MPRLSDLVNEKKRELQKKQKIEHLATLFLSLSVCDDYLLKKQEGKVTLEVFRGFYKSEFIVKEEFELAQLLGEWLVGLPKHVWDE